MLAGYLRVYGEGGLDAFMLSTIGWDGEIEDDRAAPRYPRSIAPTHEVLDLIDESLSSLGSRIVTAE